LSNKWHGGKGDKPRKTNNQKQYADNWERIFGNKSKDGKINSPENKIIPDHDEVYYPQDKDLSTRD
jgi:hypothetical protein